jgi:hypothetical protein
MYRKRDRIKLEAIQLDLISLRKDLANVGRQWEEKCRGDLASIKLAQNVLASKIDSALLTEQGTPRYEWIHKALLDNGSHMQELGSRMNVLSEQYLQIVGILNGLSEKLKRPDWSKLKYAKPRKKRSK